MQTRTIVFTAPRTAEYIPMQTKPMEEVIVGVVGVLQFEVFQYRMKTEYGVDLRMEGLPYEEIRLIDDYPG